MENTKVIRKYRGLRNLVAAEVTSDTVDKLEYSDVFPIAGLGEITKDTDQASEVSYYDDDPAVIVDGEGADTVKLTVSAIPMIVKAKLLGQTVDEATNSVMEGESTKPYFAIGYITKTTDGKDTFVWIFKGKFSTPSESYKTKSNSAESSGDELTYTAINTTHKFTETRKTAKSYKHEDSGIIASDVFFSEVYDLDKMKAYVSEQSGEE